jgi:hypothetical protein
MRMPLLIAAASLAAAPGLAGESQHFEIEAAFEPAARPGADAYVAVRFAALDPDVNLNEVPAPRLQLDDAQKLLSAKAEKTPPPPPPAKDEAPRYHDLSEPVRFPVELSADAPEGIHGVAADVIYFYCSTSQGWCRRGTEPVTIPILISR